MLEEKKKKYKDIQNINDSGQGSNIWMTGVPKRKEKKSSKK